MTAGIAAMTSTCRMMASIAGQREAVRIFARARRRHLKISRRDWAKQFRTRSPKAAADAVIWRPRTKRPDVIDRCEVSTCLPGRRTAGAWTWWRRGLREMQKSFTAKQGQYLAFIYYYSKIHGAPPAEADLQRFFRVTPPAVHQMIMTLHANGFIDREPGKARTIRLRLTREELPDLD
jgi:hypothetical protein